MVSDKIVGDLIEKFVSNDTYYNKIIFDGYPRTLIQSKNLDVLLKKYNQKIDIVLKLSVSLDTVKKRIAERRSQEKRTDDNLDTILKRYDTYMDTTKPVLDFYSKKNNFHEIDGSENITEITRKIEAFVNV